ncbi:MAG: beta-glucuronidase, partial [Chitinophagaceae bacterium]
ANIPIGNCISLGKVTYPLNQFSKAEKLRFSVSLAGTSYENGWNIWVYPDKNISAKDSSQIYFCHELNQQAKEVLKKGGKVFLLCAGKVEMGKHISMHFLPVFWNTSWFNMRPPHTTGIYLNPKNPAFRYFPTEDFSDFQWWGMVNKQQVMWLKNFPDNFRPIVQPIDTWFKDRRLGLIFDAKVSNGKLMVCSADLSSDLKNRPAARQLFFSLTKYMESKNFNPKYRVPLSTIQQLFAK